MKKNNQKGFTLVELIIVIAILGILAGLAIPRFGTFTDSARRQKDEQFAEVVAGAAMAVYADTGSVVTSVSDAAYDDYFDDGTALEANEYDGIQITTTDPGAGNCDEGTFSVLAVQLTLSGTVAYSTCK
jgi:prepilin-type N-terminal cleavage/methylation domain-containing protein